MKRTFQPNTSLKKKHYITLWFTIIVFIFLMGITIAYSALGTNLKISGDLMFRPEADIRIVDLKLDSITNNGEEDYDSEYSKKNIRIGIKLPQLNSTVTYEVTVTNFVDFEMELVDINNLILNNSNMEYVITDLSVGDIIDGLATQTFKILFKYKSDVSVLPADKSLGATINFTWAEYIPIEERLPENFVYKGYCENYEIPNDGIYKLEVWGADGGPVTTSSSNGKGGYSKGIIGLTRGEILYICVGGKGESFETSNYVNLGGFNGGGSAQTGVGGRVRTGGGGATDIRVLSNDLYNRIIVAGGGGGNSAHSSNRVAGNGGGETGADGGYGKGGSQIAGGNGQLTTGIPATFGIGGSEPTNTVGGGGGGWYGGGNGNGAGGGSGYVLTSTSYKPSGYFPQYANYYFVDIINVQYNQTGYITNPSENGSGYARITQIPIILTLNGESEETVNLNGRYTEKGATLTVDGDDKSNQIVINGVVNTNVAGDYVITYTYTEPLSGKIFSVQRTVHVKYVMIDKIFLYTGNVQNWTVPQTGNYKLEVWGAEGGQGKQTPTSVGRPGGIGGYSKGEVTLTEGTILYIQVGGRGKDLDENDSKANVGQILDGGYNGGGSITKGTYARGSGGGATDIRVLSNSLYNRIIVAGGGGGSTRLTSDYCTGGAGGGSSGEDKLYTTENSTYHGRGGTQTTGGSGYNPGTFGIGGSGTQGASAASAGGGGWYGGSGGAVWVGGGGGSGYVLTSTSYKPSGYFSQYANYYMRETLTIQPTFSGFITNPESNGNGYVKITYLP